MTVTDITSSITTPLVVVTGPTRGLGKDLALALAKRKVRLILAGRSANELAGIASTVKQAGSPWVETVTLDLASFASIAAASQRIQELTSDPTVGPLDAVVANAGIQLSNRLQTTADGLELTFGVNVVGNHYLLSSIRSQLAPAAHVVIVGSGTHFGDPLTKLVVAAPVWEGAAQLAKAGTSGVDGAETLKAGQRAYSTSKLGVNYLVHALNREWGAPIRVNIYDPGLMPGTGLARDLPKFKQWAWNNIMPVLRVLPGVATTAHSAEQLAQLTLGETHAGLSNAYIEIGKLTKASAESDNKQRETELWKFCTEREHS
jgi:NAD(P)-dependent dehydrogenase (short-subunit alcohol dehydrogenase family)